MTGNTKSPDPELIVIDIPGPVKQLVELVEMPTMPTVDVEAMLDTIIDHVGRAVDSDVAQEVASDMAYGNGLMGRNDLNEIQAMNLFNAVMTATEVLARDVSQVLGREALHGLSTKYHSYQPEVGCLLFTVSKL